MLSCADLHVSIKKLSFFVEKIESNISHISMDTLPIEIVRIIMVLCCRRYLRLCVYQKNTRPSVMISRILKYGKNILRRVDCQ